MSVVWSQGNYLQKQAAGRLGLWVVAAVSLSRRVRFRFCCLLGSGPHFSMTSPVRWGDGATPLVRVA